MNYTEAVNDVLRICKRPDKVVEAQRAINAAIAYYTIKGEFRKDLVETSISIDSSLYGNTISLTSLARFRRFKYIRPYGTRKFLVKSDPSHIFQPSGSLQLDHYYTAGDNLTYTLSVLSSSLEVGYYTYAPTLSGEDTHWLLDTIESAIIDYAAAKVFRGIGDDKSSDVHDAYSRDTFRVLLNDQALGA